MRTREYDRSIVLDNSTANVVTGGFRSHPTNGTVQCSDQYPVERKLSNREYGFFIDEPHRNRLKRFGEANRWEEKCYPNMSSLRMHNTNYNVDGWNFSTVFYDDAERWYVRDPLCSLVFNDLKQESILPSWPFRWRSRVSLNNAVQRARQRIYQYNGDIAETIGELPECPQLLKLVNTYKGLRSNATNLTLGVKFGWIPLFGAFKSALAEFDAWSTGANAVRRFEGLRNVSFCVSDDWSLIEANHRKVTSEGTLQHYEEALVPQLESHKGSITYSAVIDVKPYYDTRIWDVMSRLARIGGIPSLRTFWELAPKSFVADWFVSIGDVINDLQGNLLYHIDVKQECWSWRLHDRISQWVVNPMDNNRLTTQEVKAFYRSSTPPLGSWKVPSVRLPTDLGKLSTLALMVSQVIPDRGASLRSLMRRINRYGYR